MGDPERVQHPRLTAAAVACVLAAGLALRVDHLADKLVWHDEIATRIFAAGYTTDDWKEVIYTGRVVPVAEVRAYQNPNPDRTTWQVIDGLARLDPQHPPLYYVLARLYQAQLANARASQTEGKSFVTTLLFACMSLVSNYVMKDGN